MTPDEEVLSEVDQHLRQAETQLSIALAKFGTRCGGYRYMPGSYHDYKKAISTLLRLQAFKNKVEKVVNRYERARLDKDHK